MTSRASLTGPSACLIGMRCETADIMQGDEAKTVLEEASWGVAHFGT